MPLVAVSECVKCHRLQGEKHKAIGKAPTIRTMEKWMYNGIARATDGCKVEPDGTCYHGHSSWIMVLGYI